MQPTRIACYVLVLALGPLPPATAETCSTSTLVSPTYAFARWCGDPPAAGTLRMGRRDGGTVDYREVPLETFREVVRVPSVDKYVAAEIVPRFERQMARPAATVVPTQATASPADGTQRPSRKVAEDLPGHGPPRGRIRTGARAVHPGHDTPVRVVAQSSHDGIAAVPRGTGKQARPTQ